MRHLVVVALLFAMPVSGAGSAADQLLVSVTNVASGRGTVVAMVCDQASFLASCAFKGAAAASTTRRVTIAFRGVPRGKYAVVVFHDENDNRRLDRDALGIPTEGYGYSRAARGHGGPPRFEDAAFDFGGGESTIEVVLDY